MPVSAVSDAGAGDQTPAQRQVRRPWSAQTRGGGRSSSGLEWTGAHGGLSTQRRPSSAGPSRGGAKHRRQLAVSTAAFVQRSLLADDDRKRLESELRRGVTGLFTAADTAHHVAEQAIVRDHETADEVRQVLLDALNARPRNNRPDDDTGLIDGARPLAKAAVEAIEHLSEKVRHVARALHLRAAREHTDQPELRVLPECWSAQATMSAAAQPGNHGRLRSDCPGCFADPQPGTSCDIGDNVGLLCDLVVHLLSLFKGGRVGSLVRENQRLTRQLRQHQVDSRYDDASPGDDAAITGLTRRQLCMLRNAPGLEQVSEEIDAVTSRADSIVDLSTLSRNTTLHSKDELGAGENATAESDANVSLAELRSVLGAQNKLLRGLFKYCMSERQKESVTQKRYRSLEATIVEVHQQFVAGSARMAKEQDAKQAELNRLLLENARLRGVTQSKRIGAGDTSTPSPTTAFSCAAESKRLRVDLRAAEEELRSLRQQLADALRRVRELEARQRRQEQAAAAAQGAVVSSPQPSATTADIVATMQPAKDGAPPPPPALAAVLSSLHGAAAERPSQATAVAGGPVGRPLPACPKETPWQLEWQRACRLAVCTEADLARKRGHVECVRRRFREAVMPHLRRCCEAAFAQQQPLPVVSDTGATRLLWLAEHGALISVTPPQLYHSPATAGCGGRGWPVRSGAPPLPMPPEYWAARKAAKQRRQALRLLSGVLEGLTNFGGCREAPHGAQQLSVPLAVSLDYCGSRCTCWTAPPVALSAEGDIALAYGTTRIVGSDVRRFLAGNCVAEDGMRELLAWLNLGPQPVPPQKAGQPQRHFWGPWDLRVERTADCGMLITDPGTLLPSMAFHGDWAEEDTARPELVLSLPSAPSCAAAPAGPGALQAAESIGTKLWDKQLPRLLQALLAEFPQMEKEVDRIHERDYVFFNLSVIAERMHAWGVNLRYLGAAMDQLATRQDSETVGSVLLRTELAARIIKTQIWHDVAHAVHQVSQQRTMAPLLDALSARLSVILSDSNAAHDYWRRTMTAVAEHKFKYFAGSARPLRPDWVPRAKLFRRVCELCGLRSEEGDIDDAVLSPTASPQQPQAQRQSVTAHQRQSVTEIRRTSQAGGPVTLSGSGPGSTHRLTRLRGSQSIEGTPPRSAAPPLRIAEVVPVVKRDPLPRGAPHPAFEVAAAHARAGRLRESAAELRGLSSRRDTSGSAAAADSAAGKLGATEPPVAEWRPRQRPRAVLALLYRVTPPISNLEEEEAVLTRVVDAIRVDEAGGLHPTGVGSHAYSVWLLEIGRLFLDWHRPEKAFPFFRKSLGLLEGSLGVSAGPRTVADALTGAALCRAQAGDTGRAHDFLARALSRLLTADDAPWRRRVSDLGRAVCAVARDGSLRGLDRSLCAAALELLATAAVPGDDPCVVETLVCMAESAEEASLDVHRPGLEAIDTWLRVTPCEALQLPPGVYPVQPTATQAPPLTHPDLPGRVALLLGLAALHCAALPQQAAPLLRQAEADARTRCGEQGARRLRALWALALCSRISGDARSAAEYSGAAHAAVVRQYEPSHPAVAVSMLSHGEALATAQELEEATTVLQGWAKLAFSRQGVLPRGAPAQWLEWDEPETQAMGQLLLASVSYPHSYSRLAAAGTAPDALPSLLAAAERHAAVALRICEAEGLGMANATCRRCIDALSEVYKAQRKMDERAALQSKYNIAPTPATGACRSPPISPIPPV